MIEGVTGPMSRSKATLLARLHHAIGIRRCTAIRKWPTRCARGWLRARAICSTRAKWRNNAQDSKGCWMRDQGQVSTNRCGLTCPQNNATGKNGTALKVPSSKPDQSRRNFWLLLQMTATESVGTNSSRLQADQHP
jgi:hypothetical protein